MEVGSAPRAIGGACGHNPIPIVIPCHRVLGATGSVATAAAPGLATKRRLLELERSRCGQVYPGESMSLRGTRLLRSRIRSESGEETSWCTRSGSRKPAAPRSCRGRRSRSASRGGPGPAAPHRGRAQLHRHLSAQRALPDADAERARLRGGRGGRRGRAGGQRAQARRPRRLCRRADRRLCRGPGHAGRPPRPGAGTASPTAKRRR